MLFKRDGAHGPDAPLLPDITPKPGSPEMTPMLEANGNDFPSDPKALPNDWLGTDLCVLALLPESAVGCISAMKIGSETDMPNSVNREVGGVYNAVQLSSASLAERSQKK
jgi:hypothetical protein